MPITKLELRLLAVLWKIGPATVRRVQEALHQCLAYTTVQTMLNLLVRKGRARREALGRSFVYSAQCTQSEAQREALQDVLSRYFNNSQHEFDAVWQEFRRERDALDETKSL